MCNVNVKKTKRLELCNDFIVELHVHAHVFLAFIRIYM